MISAPTGLFIADSPNKGHGDIIPVTGRPEGCAIAVYDDGPFIFQTIHVEIASAQGMEELITALAIGVSRTDAGYNQIALLVGGKE